VAGSAPHHALATRRENSAIKTDCNDFSDFVVGKAANHNIQC
jgi:hypothetical protein